MSALFAIPEPDLEASLQLLYDRLADCFGFGAAAVRLSPRKLTGGEIRYGKPHRITISAHLPPRQQEDTLRHEAAHAWAFVFEGHRARHGPLFRRLAVRLGASAAPAPITPALEDFRKKHRIVYRCEGCGRLFPRFRPFRGARDCIPCWGARRLSRLRRVRRI